MTIPGLGGLQPPPLNSAPGGPLAGIGVQPGVSGQIIAHLVIVYGTSGGVFIYSPSPGTGNLILSLASMAGTDTYSNPYPAGFAANLQPSADVIQILFGIVSAFGLAGLSFSDTTNPPFVPGVVVGQGASTGSRLIVSSGTSTSGDSAATLTMSDTKELTTGAGLSQFLGWVSLLTTAATPGTPSGQVILYYNGTSLFALGPSGVPVTIATT